MRVGRDVSVGDYNWLVNLIVERVLFDGVLCLMCCDE